MRARKNSSTILSLFLEEAISDMPDSVYADDLTTLEYSRRILLKRTCSFSAFRVSLSEFHKNLEL